MKSLVNKCSKETIDLAIKAGFNVNSDLDFCGIFPNQAELQAWLRIECRVDIDVRRDIANGYSASIFILCRPGEVKKTMKYTGYEDALEVALRYGLQMYIDRGHDRT